MWRPTRAWPRAARCCGTGASDADDLAMLVRLVAGDHLHPEVGVTADWSETPALLEALAERRIRGNAVLTIG